MPLRRYADFQGRSRRMEYWMWVVFQILVYLVLTIMMFAVGGSVMALAQDAESPAAMAGLGGGMLIVMGLIGIFWLATIIPSLAVMVRRLHDSNKSGFWLLGFYVLVFIQYGFAITAALSAGAAAGYGAQPSGGMMAVSALLSLVVLVYAIVLLVFFFLDGTPGENRFGADPKGRGEVDVFG